MTDPTGPGASQPFTEDIEPDGPSEQTMWAVFVMMGIVTLIGLAIIVALVASDTKRADHQNTARPVPGQQQAPPPSDP